MTGTPLGIIAGRGALPRTVVEACAAQQRPSFILGFSGMEPDMVTPDRVVRIGAIGDALAALRTAGCRELVLAGKMKRPSLTSLAPDAAGAMLLKRLGKAIFQGDDALLRTLVAFMEEEGFIVLPPESIGGGQLCAAAGVLTRVAPTVSQMASITAGMAHLRVLGPLDIGQALVIERGYVLALEAAEGTDALMVRSAALMRETREAVLIKAAKPAQETRVDLPTIGPETIALLSECGFAGVAIEAQRALIVQQEAMLAMADACGVFVYGCS